MPLTEIDVRRIVRSELRRLLQERVPAAGPTEETPLRAWIRSLPAGTGGTATDLFARFLADQPGEGTGWNVHTFGRALSAESGGPGALLTKGRLRDGRSLYDRQ